MCFYTHKKCIYYLSALLKLLESLLILETEIELGLETEIELGLGPKIDNNLVRSPASIFPSRQPFLNQHIGYKI